MEDTKVLVVDHKLEVLCYAAKDLSLAAAVSKLIIPALVDQILSMRNKILSHLLTEHPQVFVTSFQTLVNFLIIHENHDNCVRNGWLKLIILALLDIKLIKAYYSCVTTSITLMCMHLKFFHFHFMKSLSC